MGACFPSANSTELQGIFKEVLLSVWKPRARNMKMNPKRTLDGFVYCELRDKRPALSPLDSGKESWC